MFLPAGCHSAAVRPAIVLSTETEKMTALYILIPASIIVAAGFLLAFIWSVRNRQFEDQKGSAIRMLYDDNDNHNNRTQL